MKSGISTVKKRFRPSSVLLLKFATDHLKVEVVRLKAGAPLATHESKIPLDMAVFFDKPEAWGSALLQHLKSSKIGERNTLVCLPMDWALSATVDLPQMSAEDLPGYLEIQGERKFPMAGSEMSLGYSAFILPDQKKCATLAAIPSAKLEAIRKALGVAGCKIASVSLGLDGYIRSDQAGGIHCLNAADRTDLIVAAGGGIASFRSISNGPASSSKRADSAALRQEVRMTLGRLPSGIVPQIKEVAIKSDQSGNPDREIMDMFVTLGIQPASSTEPSSLGTAARYLNGSPVAFEFVMVQRSQIQSFMRWFAPKSRRWLSLSAAGLILIPFLAYTIHTRMESNLQDEWSQIQPKAMELEKLQDKIRVYRPWFDTTAPSLQLLERMVQHFPEKGDVWAKSLALRGNSSVICTANARSESAKTEFLKKLREDPQIKDATLKFSKGEPPRLQFAFEFNWSPNHGE